MHGQTRGDFHTPHASLLLNTNCQEFCTSLHEGSSGLDLFSHAGTNSSANAPCSCSHVARDTAVLAETRPGSCAYRRWLFAWQCKRQVHEATLPPEMSPVGPGGHVSTSSSLTTMIQNKSTHTPAQMKMFTCQTLDGNTAYRLSILFIKNIYREAVFQQLPWHINNSTDCLVPIEILCVLQLIQTKSGRYALKESAEALHAMVTALFHNYTTGHLQYFLPKLDTCCFTLSKLCPTWICGFPSWIETRQQPTALAALQAPSWNNGLGWQDLQEPTAQRPGAGRLLTTQPGTELTDHIQHSPLFWTIITLGTFSGLLEGSKEACLVWVHTLNKAMEGFLQGT